MDKYAAYTHESPIYLTMNVFIIFQVFQNYYIDDTYFMYKKFHFVMTYFA